MRPIADWKNANEYPKWNAVSLKWLAWEFLRRNPAYQAAWAEYLATCRRLVPDFDPHVVRDWDALSDHDDYFYYDPRRLEGENEFAWSARVGHGSIMPLHKWYANKWGFADDFPDPFYSYEKYELGGLAIQFEKSGTRVVMAGNNWKSPDGHLITRAPKQALIIDYSIPIEQQLNAAKEYLFAHQRILIREGVVKKFPNKIPRKELVTYLRMLDANAGGIRAKGIAAVIYPSDKNLPPDFAASDKVRKALAIAKKWRDDWYYFIPSMKK
jgi:hypothetical protein